MQQRGRKSAASLAVVGADVPGISRLGPPSTLTDGERAVWLATVNSKPAEWFGSEHVPLLVNYVRHTVAADVIDAQIRDFDPEWLKKDEGLDRYEKLRKLFRQETEAINRLARAMRLTHQSIYRADKAATLTGKARGRKPWEE
jgi:hypothetical protein